MIKLCPKCSRHEVFYSSVKHMCKLCWSQYQREHRLKRLASIKMAPQGRPVKGQDNRAVDPTRHTWTSLSHAAGYLAGIIDGEGHIQFYMYGGKSVQVANTDLSIIEATCAALEKLEITYKVRKDLRYSKKQNVKYKDCYTIFIYRRENFEKIQALVPLCSVKRAKLTKMIGSYKYDPTYRVSSYEKGGDAYVLTG